MAAAAVAPLAGAAWSGLGAVRLRPSLAPSLKTHVAGGRRRVVVALDAGRGGGVRGRERAEPPSSTSSTYPSTSSPSAASSSSSTPPPVRQPSPLAPMPIPRRNARQEAEVVLSRKDLVGKQVITRTLGSVLGVVSQLWVDMDQWEVVALDIREALLYGEEESILLSSLRQVGDVVLVHDDNAIEWQFSVDGYSTLVGSEVVTESGIYMGKIRDFDFNPDNGSVTRIVFDNLGVPAVPSAVLSTYALSTEEVVSAGLDRIIVLDTAPDRVQQLSTGVLEKLALVSPPWKDEFEEMGYDVYSDEDFEDRYRSGQEASPRYAERRRDAKRPQRAYASNDDEFYRNEAPIVNEPRRRSASASTQQQQYISRTRYRPPSYRQQQQQQQQQQQEAEPAPPPERYQQQQYQQASSASTSAMDRIRRYEEWLKVEGGSGSGRELVGVETTVRLSSRAGASASRMNADASTSEPRFVGGARSDTTSPRMDGTVNSTARPRQESSTARPRPTAQRSAAYGERADEAYYPSSRPPRRKSVVDEDRL